MFIVSLTYKVALSQVDEHIAEHITFLEKHYASGHFIASGRKVPRTGGVILVDAPSLEEVEAIIKQDPFNTLALASYEICEFIPTMAAQAFERLKKCV